MGGGRGVSILSHRPVTSSDLKQERLFFRESVSTFLQLVVAIMRVSMGWWHLRLSAKILALLRLSANFFQLWLTKKLKINFFCFKTLNIN